MLVTYKNVLFSKSEMHLGLKCTVPVIYTAQLLGSQTEIYNAIYILCTADN